MSIETMFIRIPLRSTLFAKHPRAVLLNLQQLHRCELEKKQIQFFFGDRTIFGEVPFLMRYDTHEDAQQRFQAIEQLLVKQPPPVQKQERLDMPSPDALALAALEEYDTAPRLK